MGAKENGLYFGSTCFLVAGCGVAAILGPYVHSQTKDKSLAKDNMM